MDSHFKAILCILVFFFSYLAFGFFNFSNYGIVNNGQDFWFHWDRINGVFDPVDYPVGYHLLFMAFSENMFLFYAANLFVVVVLIPFLVFRFSRSWWSVAFYFGGVSLPHMILYGATYPHAIILFLFLIYLCYRRNFLLLMILFLVSFFIHHYGPFLFGLVFFAEVLEIVFSKARPAVGFLLPSQMHGLHGAIEAFLIHVPLPVFWLSLKSVKGAFFSLIMIVSFVFSVENFRAITIFQLVAVIFASKTVEEWSLKGKACLLLFLFVQCVFYLIDFGFGTWKYIVFN